MTQLSQAMNFSLDLQEEGVGVKNKEALGIAMQKHIKKYNVAGMDGNQLFLQIAVHVFLVLMKLKS